MTEYTFARLEDVDASAAQAAAIAAAASAAAALVSETNSATSETNAAASAAAAALSEIDAEAAAVAAEAALDDFTDIYLGSFNSDPVTDNDGGPLATGMLYWNDVANELRVYDEGAIAWIAASILPNGVASASTFNDNRLVRTDTTPGTRFVQQSGITVTDTDDVNDVASMDFNAAATLDFDGGDVVLTHSVGVLDLTTGELRQGGSPVVLDSDIGSTVQAFDSDLAAIAALTTTSFGRGLLELANDTALAAIVDPFFLTPAEGNAAYQPLDVDLTAIAGLSPSNDDIIQRKGGVWTNRTIAQLLTDLATPGTTFQPLDSDLTAIAALSTDAAGRSILVLTDPNADRIAFWDDSAGAYAHLTVGNGLAISTTTLAIAAPTLATDVSQTLAVGYPATSDNDGTQSSGTYTPDPATGHFKHITANGAFTLAVPTASGSYTLIIQVTNGASAGAITTSGYSDVSGDTYATTNGNDYFFYITKHNGFSHLHITALQ